MDLRTAASLATMVLVAILTSAASDRQAYEESFPIMFIDFIGERPLFQSPRPDLDKGLQSFRNAFQTMAEESNEFQLLQQENVQRPQYVDPGEIPNDDVNVDAIGYGRRREMKKSEQVAQDNRDDGNRYRYLRTKANKVSGPYRDGIHFDDSTYGVQRSYGSPRSVEPSVDDKIAADYDDTAKSDEEQSLLLTLGGYQRPSEKTQFDDEKQNLQHHKLKDVKKEQASDSKHDPQSNAGSENVARDPTSYNGELQSVQPQIERPGPAMGYGQRLSDAFVSPESNYNPGMMQQPYPGFGYNDYFSSTPAFHYNPAVHEKAYSNELNRYNIPFSRGFYPQPIQTNVLSAETPLSSPMFPTMHSAAMPHASFQNTPYNPYARAPTEDGNSRSYPLNSMLNVPAFYDRTSANLANQNPSHSNNWNSDSRFLFTQQPGSVPNLNLQPMFPHAGVANMRFSNKENEQKLESVSEDQGESGSKSNQMQNVNNQYLNYPTQNAGYGTVESLPAINSASANKPLGPDSPTPSNLPFHPQYRVTGIRYRQPFPSILPPFSTTNQNPLPQMMAPGLGNENSTSNFDTLEYFKNLRVNYPFPPMPGNIDDAMFHRYPERPTGNPLMPAFQSPPFAPGSEDVRASTVPSDIYEFLSARGPAPEADTGENVTPACASKSNDSVCFEDPEYPTQEVMYAVDSEALQLRRFLSPSSFQGAIGLNELQDADVPSEEDPGICEADVQRGHPLRAQDADGKWKIIVNIRGTPRMDGFAQDVRLETCSLPSQACSHTEKDVATQCVQKYSVNRLLAWDARRGLHTSLFKLPIACVCQLIKSERPN